MNTRLQFRVLYREFLFRLMDVELLSASASGDANTLFGQFGALLVFGSALLAYAALPVGAAVRRVATAAPVWSAERSLMTLTMLVVGVFALLNWDSTFPDRRDVLVLGPLPVRGRVLLAAKIAAAASALGLVLVALHCLSGFAWPIALTPDSGIAGTLRFLAAFWVTLLAAGAFIYCVALGMQGVAAQLPRRWYLRASSVLQIAGFGLFLGVTFFQPSLNTVTSLQAPENQRALAWLPSYWFMGLLSELSGAFAAEGHAVMAPLARRALAGLGIAMFVAGAAFLLSYLRTLRKIVEEPDVMPGSRSGVWLPRFGSNPQTALVHFVIRTLLRSRPHRVVLASYLGGGFAIAAVYLAGGRAQMHLTWTDLVRRVNPLLPVASVLMLCALWLGIRTVFSLPLDLRANWLFRVTPVPGSVARLAAVRRALLTASVLPVMAVSAALLWFWPWAPVAEHLLVLALLGSILADISLASLRKIPFTCSYLPGKSKVHMVFWFGIIPAVYVVHKFVEFELRAMAHPPMYWITVVILGSAAVAARQFATRRARRSAPEIQFEEAPADELVALGLQA